ncbi:MAG TPA: hypothetical protein VG013_24665 [Gemmataceae bacterium]|nr:hypothetical protein [Gemmataceae bacterium]
MASIDLSAKLRLGVTKEFLAHGEKCGHRHSPNVMKISVNMAPLTNEQVKCLSQLGAFGDDQMWESCCEPEDIQEALALLERAGVYELFLQLGPENPHRASEDGEPCPCCG